MNEGSIMDYFVVNIENWSKIKDVKSKRNAEISSDSYLEIIELFAQNEIAKEHK